MSYGDYDIVQYRGNISGNGKKFELTAELDDEDDDEVGYSGAEINLDVDVCCDSVKFQGIEKLNIVNNSVSTAPLVSVSISEERPNYGALFIDPEGRLYYVMARYMGTTYDFNYANYVPEGSRRMSEYFLESGFGRIAFYKNENLVFTFDFDQDSFDGSNYLFVNFGNIVFDSIFVRNVNNTFYPTVRSVYPTNIVLLKDEEILSSISIYDKELYEMNMPLNYSSYSIMIGYNKSVVTLRQIHDGDKWESFIFVSSNIENDFEFVKLYNGQENIEDGKTYRDIILYNGDIVNIGFSVEFRDYFTGVLIESVDYDSQIINTEYLLRLTNYYNLPFNCNLIN